MRHVYWVIDGILAGRPGPTLEPWSPTGLRDSGIGAIVSLAGPVDSRPLTRSGIDHLPVTEQIPFDEAEQSAWFERWMPAILNRVVNARPFETAVLIHCHYGIQRTGVVLACACMVLEQLEPEHAVGRIRSIRPRALSGAGNVESVRRFAETIAREPSKWERWRMARGY